MSSITAINARLAENRRARLTVALLVFILLTAAWFWTITFDPAGKILRGPADGTLTIRGDWATSVQGKNPFNATHDYLNGAPEGIPYLNAITWLSPVQGGINLLFHYAVGWLAAWNLFILLGFVLTGFVTFLLLDSLDFHPLASFFGGYVMAFNPWIIDRAEAGHAAFVHVWIFPALMLVLLRMSRLRTARSAAVVGLFYGLTFLFAAYDGLIASVLLGTYLIVELIRVSGFEEKLWTLTLTCTTFIVGGLMLVPGVVKYVGTHHAVATTVSNANIEAQRLGGSSASYVLPSQTHPLLGWITRFDPAARNWSEHSLFFGYSTMILAVIAVVLLLRHEPATRATAQRRTALVFAAVLLPVAWWASLRSVLHPFGSPFGIPTLSWFVVHVTNYFRVYARIAVLVGMSFVVLSAFTLDRIARKGARGRWVVVGLTGLVAFELLTGSITAWNATNPPGYDRWLATQPRGIVANYPLPTDQSAALSLGAREIYFQIFTKQPLYNIFGPGTGNTREDAIRILSRYITDPATPSILAAEHVRYVLLHDDVYREEGEAPPPAPPELRLVKRFPDVRVYVLRKSTKPADLPALLNDRAAEVGLVEGLTPPVLSFVSGFSPPAVGGSQAGWRSLKGPGVFTLSNHDANTKRAQILLRAESPGVPRTLDVIDSSGNVVQKFTIGTGLTEVGLGPFPIGLGKSHFAMVTETHASTGPDLLVAPSMVQVLADYSIVLATE